MRKIIWATVRFSFFRKVYVGLLLKAFLVGFLSSCAREPKLWISTERIIFEHGVDEKTFIILNAGRGELEVKIEAEDPLKVDLSSFKLGEGEERKVILSLSYRPEEDLKRKVVVRGDGRTHVIEVNIERRKRLIQRRDLLIDAVLIVSPKEHHSLMFAVSKDMISPSLLIEFSIEEDHIRVFLMDDRSYEGWVAGYPVDHLYYSNKLSDKIEIGLIEGKYYLVIENRALFDRVVRVRAVLRYQAWE